VLRRWEASSVNRSPSSQTWRVNLVSPSSPTDWNDNKKPALCYDVDSQYVKKILIIDKWKMLTSSEPKAPPLHRTWLVKAT
jgi:hypothetical protein